VSESRAPLKVPLAGRGPSAVARDTEGWQARSMNIDEWWSRLDSEAQEWLIVHNGEAVPDEVLSQITAAGGVVASDVRWVGESGPSGFFLSDEATDWIEATANGE